ncbi:hypothetical protein QAD02_012307 [Eretmocerus hayati]|uniref:Uncharacterized protein n=1 Tax=Eretmocerus hayati TaxID=131215 RepID=A0ACC2NZ83_9HYME|nr:hypothetical protein QAD02_012307 [Eretmocerus hayati]
MAPESVPEPYGPRLQVQGVYKSFLPNLSRGYVQVAHKKSQILRLHTLKALQMIKIPIRFHLTAKCKRTFSGNDALSIERHKDAALSQETEDPNIVEETQEIPDSQVQNDLSCYKQGNLDNNPDKADENEVEANLQKMFASDNEESSLAATSIIKSTGSIADNEVERNLEKMFDNESDDDNEV